MHTLKLNEPKNKDRHDIVNQMSEENRLDYGYYLMRTNYKRIKPHSKYTQEGARPRSPNVPYSSLSQELINNNQKNAASVFHIAPSKDDELAASKGKKPRYFVERHADSVSQHLTRDLARTQPYCFIRKDAHSNDPPKEYTNSLYGAYPTWGPEKTGFRTKSHDLGEPVERFTNIDLYRRPLTNQPGRIIFDYGRPNNGYYLQRNQYDNTWFNSSHKLNRTGILDSIAPKSSKEYQTADDLRKTLVRSKTLDWPFASEYVEKFTLKSKQ